MSAASVARSIAPTRSSRLLADAPAVAPGPVSKQRERLLFHAKVLAVVLVIAGSRAWLVSTYTCPVPLWDQWESEAGQLYIPRAEHRFDPAVLTSPHNEHRILFNRLVCLGLLELGGQWDTRLEMVVSLLTATATAWILMLVLPAMLGQHRQHVIMLLVGVVWTLPFCWSNITCGFQMAFYFLAAFSVLTIWGLLSRPNFSAGWWLGACCAVAAIFTIGSGFLAAAAVVVAKCWNMLADRKGWRTHLPSLAVAIGAVIVGYWLSYSPPHHDQFRSRTIGDFVPALAYSLAWPCVKYRWLAVIMYLPTAMLAANIIRRRAPLTPAQLFVVGIVAWTLLQAAGLAYARGLHPPANRFVDVQSFGPLANLLALIVLADEWKPDHLAKTRIWFRLLIVAWAVTFAAGLLHETKRLGKALEDNYAIIESGLIACQQFMASDRSAPFPEEKNLPHPRPAAVMDRLRHPGIQAILPPALQNPPALHDAGPGSSAFVENGFYPTTGKYLGQNVVGSHNQLGNANVGAFRSGLIEPKFAYLQIPIAGYPNAPGQSLKLVVEETQEVIPIKVKQDPHETWSICRVRAPSKPFRLVAEDQNPQAWFAFAAPRQLSWLSAMNETLLRWSWFMISGGAALFLLATGTLKGLMDEVLAAPLVARAS